MNNGYFWTYTALPRHQNARCESVNAIIDAIIVGFDGVPSAGAIQQDRVTHSTDTGAADAYVIAPTYPIVSYTAGQHYTFVAAHANTMASTVNVSALGVKTIKRQDGTDLSAGDIALGQVVDIRYDGTYFQLMSVPSGTVAASAASATAAAASATAAASSASAASTSASAASTSATAAALSAATLVALPTRQLLTSGTGATYTRPSGPAPRQLKVRMVGGGGGSGGDATVSGATAGGTGGTTTFNSITAIGGGGSPAGNPAANVGGGIGGTGGTGTAFRAPGNAGQSGQVSSGNGAFGGAGGGSLLGGGARGGVGAVAGAANSGGGASGPNNGSTAGTTAPGGGGGGEYVEIIINSPSATYTYTVGTAGAAGTGDTAGAAGGTGYIIVEEIY